MKTTFKVTEDGLPAIVLTPESGEETVLLSVFSAQCKSDGWRVAGADHLARNGTVDEVTLFPFPAGDREEPDAKARAKK